MKQQEAFLGIDVSKGYADFMFLDGQKQPIEKPFQLDDTWEGHHQLETLLHQVQQQHDIGMFYCGLESTGGFENNWYAMLQRTGKTLPLKVSRLNPAGVKANTEAGLNRNITDSLSSRYIKLKLAMLFKADTLISPVTPTLSDNPAPAGCCR